MLNGATVDHVITVGKHPQSRLGRLGEEGTGHVLVPAVENVAVKPHPDALPNHENAIIPDAKLRGYALNQNHPIGGHKARVIESALGFTAESADALRVAILDALPGVAATPHVIDDHGHRYTVDVPVTGPAGSAIVRPGWIVREPGGAPSMTSIRVENRGEGAK